MFANLLFPSKDLTTPERQGADFVELFFDLIFVYAITRITGMTAHHLDAVHILQSMLIFWLIWWGWTQFTWALNAANTRLAQVRMMVLIATGIAFVMASSVDEAFGDGVMWFVVPYILIRLIGLALYIRVTTNLSEMNSAVKDYALPSILGLIAVFAGGLADPSYRAFWWIGAIVLDMLAGYLGGRSEGWDLQTNHFAERHGLIVIIALGESLIVAANAIDSQARSHDLLIVGGLAVMITCLLWWSYFAWINEHMEDHFEKTSGSIQARLARDTYSFIHFPLVMGIIGVSVGFELILGHPHDMLSPSVAHALCVGYALFVGSTAVSVYRSSKLILLPRMIILVLTLTAIELSIGHSPKIALSMIVIGLIVTITLEWKKCRHA